MSRKPDARAKYELRRLRERIRRLEAKLRRSKTAERWRGDVGFYRERIVNPDDLRYDPEPF